MNLNKVKRVHMVGIGGIGMSGIARIFLDKGIDVSGSDLVNNNIIEGLRAKKCSVRIGHSRIIGSPDLVVRSSSIGGQNPEIVEALKRGIPVLARMEILDALFQSKKYSIAVTGTHGKTTTSAMISYIFDKAGLDPTVLIGGELDYFMGNAKSGKSDIIISEADESDGYIDRIRARFKVITNIEKEHLEHYKTMKNLLSAFERFIKNRKDACLIYNRDNKNLRKLADKVKPKRISYGFSKDCEYYPRAIKDEGLRTEYMCLKKGKNLGPVILNVPGRHNVFNSLASIITALEFGLPFKMVSGILESFKGAKRRFDIRSQNNNIMLVEDYAHHPTEIRTVINIARKLKRSRVITVFQPHRFTRTMYLRKEFARAFTGSDELILTDIYAASEKPIEGVSVKNIYDGVREKGLKRVRVLRRQEITGYIKRIAKPNDIILVLGAGNINGIVPEIDKALCEGL